MPCEETLVSQKDSVRTGVPKWLSMPFYFNLSQSLSLYVVILNGVQNADIEYGDVYFSEYFTTESLDLEFEGVSGNLCNLAVEENLYGDGNSGDDDYQDDGYNKNDGDNGDDNYQDDGDNGDAYYQDDSDNGDDNYQDNNNGDDDAQCVLEDGVYGFSTEITIPSYEGPWSDTGWEAAGQVDIYTYGRVQIGSCEASFRLLSPIEPSAKTLFYVVLPLIGVVSICILTYYGIRMVICCNRGYLCWTAPKFRL